MDPMERQALERKRIEMRARSQRLERERRSLLRIAVHNSAREKAEKYGIQWEDVVFVDEDADNGEAGEDPVGGLEALWRHLDINDEDEDVDDMEWEGEAAGGDSSDEWTTEPSGSASGGGSSTSSGEWEFSDRRPCGSAEDDTAEEEDDFMLEDVPGDLDETLSAGDFMLEDVPEDLDETLSAGSASPPLRRQTSEEWTDCSSWSTVDGSSGGDEPEDESID